MVNRTRIPRTAVILAAVAAALLVGFLAARLYYAHRINEAYGIIREVRIPNEVPGATTAPYQSTEGANEYDRQEA